MRLSNRSRYRSEDLRAIVAAALRERGVPSTGLVVEVVASRKWITGRAKLGKWRPRWAGDVEARKEFRPGRWMLLRLPYDPNDNQRAGIARVVDHEVAHLAGLRHADMSDALRDCVQAIPWLGDLPLRVEERDEEADRSAAFDRKLEHARAMLAKAGTRVKRAKTIEVRWIRRVRALEARLEDR